MHIAIKFRELVPVRLTYLAVCAVLAVCGIFFARPHDVHAATCNFQSVGTSDFNTAGNWSCGHVPTTGDDVLVGAGTSTSLSANIDISTLSASGTVSAVTFLLNVTSTVDVLSGGVVTSTSGVLAFQAVSSTGSIGSNSGAISVTSTVINNGTIDIGSGTTTFVGNATNTASGTINNRTGTLSVQSDFENIGTYNGQSGTFLISGAGAQRIGGATVAPVASGFFNLSVIKTGGTATLFNNVTSTNNVTLTSGTFALNDKTVFVGGNWLNNGGTLTNGGGLSIVQFNGAGGQTIGAETGFGTVQIKKSGGNATTTGNITVLAMNVTSGSLDLGGTTMTISGNGGTNPFTVAGTFNSGTSTVVYSTNAAATTQVASTNFYNLTITGTLQAYNMAASTTAVNVFTVGAGSTVTIAAATTLTTLGTMVNAGTVTLGAGAGIVHRAESFAFTSSTGTPVTSYTTPATLYVTVQDSNRNLLGTTVETYNITVTSTAAAGSDSEVVALTETGASTGIFRNAGLTIMATPATATNNGLFEVAASGQGLSTYLDSQDATDGNPFSVTLTYSASSGGSGGSGGGGSGGGGGGGIGGPGIPAPVTHYESVTFGTNPAATEALLTNLKNIHVAVHGLVKIQDDKNPLTQEDSAVYYVGADGKRHAFPNLRVYSTWYSDFSGVQIIPLTDLATIPLGANVTYKPGKKMVKFTTDPKVYAVAKGGLLRWIKSEAAAKELYGSSWNKNIDDINDAFYANYKFGPDVNGISDFNPVTIEGSVTYPSDSLQL